MSAAKVGRKSAGPFEEEEEDMHKTERRKGKRGGAKRSGRGRKRVEVVDMDDHNDDHCEACHDGGHLLCCDNCDFAFHFTCTQPPLLPDTPLSDSEPWYCRRCDFLMKQKSTPAKATGPFGAIFDLSSSLNPHTFSLPASFKKQTHTEQNKARDAKDLDFADLLKNPEKALARYTADEVSDNRRRRGKSCNICNLTDNQALLLSCDYCRRNYHPYCLNPVPISDSDWTCPNSTEAKHITKTKRSLSKAAHAQVPPEELTRISYLQAIPFVLDLTSGWAPKELPTDGLSVNGVRLLPLPQSKAVPRLMSADAPRKPRSEPSAKQTGKRSAARAAAAQPVASTARQVAEAEEIAAVMHNTPAHHATGMEWGSMKIDFDSDLFASQYDTLLSFLKPTSREEAWGVAKSSVVNSATLLRNSTPLNIQPPWTSPAEEQQRFKATITHASSLAQKCSHASFDDQLLPALKEMMRQPVSQSELLKFLGFQRLEQLYRFGYQVSSHHKAMDKVSEQQQLQMVNPGASSAYLLHLANGIDHAPIPQEGRKRSLMQDTSAVPLGPMRKVAKLKEHQGPSSAPLLISVSEEDWDALIDQTLAARNAAVMENSSSRSANSSSGQSTTTASGRARKNSANSRDNANASTSTEKRQSQQQSQQASSAAQASQSHPTPPAKQNQTSAAAANQHKTPNEAKQNASYISPKPNPSQLPGTSRFYVPPGTLNSWGADTPPSTQKGGSRSTYSTPSSASQTPTATSSSSANHMDLTDEGTGTPPISPPTSKQSSSAGRPKNLFHSDESVHHENMNRNTFTIVTGTGGGAAPIVTPKPGSQQPGAPSHPASTEQLGSSTSTQGGSAAHANHQAGQQSGHFIQYQYYPRIEGNRLRDEDVDYTPDNDPEKRRKAKQGAARKPKEPKESREKEEVAISAPSSANNIILSDSYNWKSTTLVPATYWTTEKVKQLKALRTLDLHQFLTSPTHSLLTTLVGKKDLIVWKLSLPSTSIGRELNSNVNLLQLGGTKVSREHAVIKHSNRKWSINILGKHGIFLNGAKMEQYDEFEIVDGDQLDFHFIRLIFRCN